MNTKLFLLLGTSVSLIPNLTFAQCVATQDCETLGYTETSCKGSKGIKCPFGNKWACLTSEEECLNLACDKLGFTYTCTGTGEKGVGNNCNGKYQGCTCDSSYQYTCSGTGYSGGSGSACGGKYTSCTCASGYEWKDGTCQKKVLNGAQGDLYYCNGTVVGVKSGNMNFYIAIQDLGLMSWDTANSRCLSYTFCDNKKGILPTKDQLVTIYNNKSAINSLRLANGGIKLTENYHWSSTYYSDAGIYGNKYYKVHLAAGSANPSEEGMAFYVLPILATW